MRCQVWNVRGSSELCTPAVRLEKTAMFLAIKNLWPQARSTGLKNEVVDALDKLSRTSMQVRVLCATTFLDALADVQQDFGPLDTLSNDQRRDLSEKFSAAGRETFDYNVGDAYGLFLVSAFLEASALPGQDAKYALELVSQYHRQALAIQFTAKRDGN